MTFLQISSFLKFYRITSGGLLLGLIAVPLVFRYNPIYAAFASAILTLLLVVIVFQIQRLHALDRTLSKLDELLGLLREAKRPLTLAESQQLQQELERVRAALLHDRSMKRTKFPAS